MEKNQKFKTPTPTIILGIYVIYFIFGFFYNGFTENRLHKEAQEKADTNKNGVLEIAEILSVYKRFNYDGEKLLSRVALPYDKQMILVAKLAQVEENRNFVSDFKMNNTSFRTQVFIERLADTDKNGGVSFEEGAVAFRKVYESYPDWSYSLNLEKQGTNPTQDGYPYFIFQIFFNLYNLTDGSELQRYVTGQ